MLHYSIEDGFNNLSLSYTTQLVAHFLVPLPIIHAEVTTSDQIVTHLLRSETQKRLCREVDMLLSTLEAE